MSTAEQSRSGPLADLVVVDLSRALAGPHAAMVLGDLGARVIKVEAPGSGDDSRGWGPPFRRPSDDGHTAGGPADEGAESTYFLACNRNKESIVLDLKAEPDRATLWRLLEVADVVVENFRPGVLDRLGLGTEAMLRHNPRLIVLSITGFGHDGPEGSRAGYDQIAQGEGGLMSVTGPGPDQPQKVGVPIADLLAGMSGVHGVLAALHERSRTDRGQVVRTSLLSALVGVHAFQGTRWTVAGEVGYAQGNHHPAIAPYGLFRCRDGAVQIAAGSETLWTRLCEALGLDPSEPGLATNAERVAARDRLIGLLERAFSTWDAEPLLARLDAAGVPSGRVRTLDEVYAWEQTRSQGLLVDVEHPTLGTLRLPGPPLRFFDADGTETTRRDHGAPPALDADGAAVRRWLNGADSTASGAPPRPTHA